MNKYPQGWKVDELFESDKDLWDAHRDEEEHKAIKKRKKRKIERRKARKANRKKKQDDK